MSITLPDDAETAIARLSRPLQPSDRIAFRQAAEAALNNLSCLGPGSIHRVLAGLQHQFFSPPNRTSWDIEQEIAPTKLKNAPAIEHAGDGRRKQTR